MVNTNLKQTFFDKYTPYAMAVVLLIGMGILGWWGYRFYLDRIEQAAFKDLAENIEAFNKFIAMSPDKQQNAGGVDRLEDLERAIDTGVKRHSSSKLIPFFYLYKADALIQKGDFVGAVGALENALNKLEKSDPFYYLFLTKKALVQVDHESTNAEGLKALNDLGLDKDNPFAPMASYYLGLHYYHLGGDKKATIDQAKAIWQSALDRRMPLTASKECSWCELIRAKLKTIS